MRNRKSGHSYLTFCLASLACLLAVYLVAGCGSSQPDVVTPQPTIASTAQQVGLANPATKFCLEQGGRSEIRSDPAGGQVGFCIFLDNSECEEWAFMRGECAPGAAYRAPDQETCLNFASELGGLFDKQAVVGYVPFEPGGTACQAQVTGTGAEFLSLVVVNDAVSGLFARKGWQQENSYSADGPAGTASGYVQGKQLCLFSAEWAPAAGVDCPDDRPIGDCGLSGDQQNYTLLLTCAREP